MHGISNNSHQSFDASSDAYSARGGASVNSASYVSEQSVDEAYRRWGQRLSLRAHGDEHRAPQRLASIGMCRSSVFELYHKNYGSEQPPVGRTAKVAKMRYSDHGDHHKESDSLLKKLTFHAKETFRQWEEGEHTKGKNKKRGSPTRQLDAMSETSSSSRQQYRQHHLEDVPQKQQQQHPYSPARQNNNHNNSNTFHHRETSLGPSESDISPQRQALSQLALEERLLQKQRHHSMGGRKQPPAQGLLTAVMERSSSRGTSTDNDSSVYDNRSVSSRASSLAASSVAAMSTGGASGLHPAVRGKCLTQPSDPVANEGSDNAEGNLIVHENDIIAVNRKDVHTVVEGPPQPRTVQYRIRRMLGQGTFAQVFQCQDVETNQLVALKIVKNKEAFNRQAVVEIDVFEKLMEEERGPASSGGSVSSFKAKGETIVNLLCYFVYRSHLCLVFEPLGLNLYEVLKRRQFRGLPLTLVRSLVKQAVEGIKLLSHKSIVHCDLKPENVLLVSERDVESVVGAGEGKLTRILEKEEDNPGRKLSSSLNSRDAPNTEHSHQHIKLIDFGSACFEGYTSHTYIQSRFYRSPEVLVGLPYDSAIDMWSLGCIAAELFLGLPILPGVHEHDQLGRICEMISNVPDWMLDQGSKSTKYFVRYLPSATPVPNCDSTVSSNMTQERKPQWRIKTPSEYVNSLSPSEIRKKGGLEKLEQQPKNRYFKRTKLSDIIMLHGQSCARGEMELLESFVHFLYGILDPDPWKRWTAHQASQHPFLTNAPLQGRRKGQVEDLKEENQANREFNMFWKPPWDAGICRRRLLNVQTIREKQSALRRNFSQSNRMPKNSAVSELANSLNQQNASSAIDSAQYASARGEPDSPPTHVNPAAAARQSMLSASLGSAIPVGATGSLANQLQPPNLQSTSSLSEFSNPGMEFPSIAMAPPQNIQNYMVGPQSFSGAGYEGLQGAPVDQDFTYALQRPGIVPGMGGDAASLSSLSLTQSQHQQQQQQQQYGGIPQQQLPSHVARANAASGLTALMAGEANHNRSYSYDMGGQRSSLLSEQLGEPPLQAYGLNGQLSAGARYAYQQQHQAAQQNHGVMPGTRQQQYGMSPYGTTGSGYYYVASATGGTAAMMSQQGMVGQPSMLPSGASSVGSYTENNPRQYGGGPAYYGQQAPPGGFDDRGGQNAMAGSRRRVKKPFMGGVSM